MSTQPADDLVLTEQRGWVRILTLNRPQAMNSFNRELAEALGHALDELDADPSVRVGVLTGAGRGFSAGLDLKAFVAAREQAGNGTPPVLDDVGRHGMLGIVAHACDKPLIAAVERFALAGGLEVALGCDLLVASEGTRLGIPEVGVGLFAGAGALLRLPRQIPYSLAMEMALTAEPITAETAHQHGLVNRLCAPGQALDTAVELAQRIAQNAPMAVRASKRLLRNVAGVTEADFWEFQRPALDEVFSSHDAVEGASAFAQKRDPDWQDR